MHGAPQPTGGAVDGGQGASTSGGRRHRLDDHTRVLRLAADLLADGGSMSFPSKPSVAASGRELACPMDRMGRAYGCCFTSSFQSLHVLPRRAVALDAAAERLLTSMGRLLTTLTLRNAGKTPDVRSSIDTLSDGTAPHTHRPRGTPRWA